MRVEDHEKYKSVKNRCNTFRKIADSDAFIW